MIRVLVVDDSALMRRQLTEWLSKAPDIQIVGTAADPYLARDKIIELKPDVITLDVEMPRMDGLTFLSKLMRYFPMPVIIFSSLSWEGSLTVIQAMELGAVDAVCKPQNDTQVPDVMKTLVEKLRVAALAHIRKRSDDVRPTPLTVQMTLSGADKKILAIGASTGGTEAIAKVMQMLPETTPATIITQHMPEYFTKAFAARLNSLSPMEVREGKNGDVLKPGLALVAPGGFHMLLFKGGSGQYSVLVREGPKVFHQRPSVEVMFNSVAKYAGANAVGVILTGMGADGGSGLLTMRQAGAYTIAQDEASSVVYGMPKVAAELGGAISIQSLDKIPGEVMQVFQRMSPIAR